MSDATAVSASLWQPRLLLLTLTHIVGTAGYMSVMAMAPVIRGEDRGGPVAQARDHLLGPEAAGAIRVLVPRYPETGNGGRQNIEVPISIQIRRGH